MCVCGNVSVRASNVCVRQCVGANVCVRHCVCVCANVCVRQCVCVCANVCVRPLYLCATASGALFASASASACARSSANRVSHLGKLYTP